MQIHCRSGLCLLVASIFSSQLLLQQHTYCIQQPVHIKQTLSKHIPLCYSVNGQYYIRWNSTG